MRPPSASRGFDQRFLLRIVIALLVGVGSGFLLIHTRGYFLNIAILMGLALAILAYSAIQTTERLWRMWARRRRD